MIVAWLIFGRKMSHDYRLKVAGVVVGDDQRAWLRARLALDEEKKRMVDAGYQIRATGIKKEVVLDA